MPTNAVTRAITIHLDPAKRAELDAIAAATSREPAAVVEEAINTYLQFERWRHDHIVEGLRQADAGEFAADDEIFEAFNRRR